jgi:hypothetical protein
VSSEQCDAIAKMRRRLQRIPVGKLLFLDETHVRLSEAPTHTLVAPGEQPFVVVPETASYAPRYDMIACCSVDRVFPPRIYAPSERHKGITAAALLAYIRDILAQAAGALDRYPLTLVVDRARIHNVEQMLQEFHDWGCQEMQQILLLPAESAKRLSPLDNALFHDWKEAVRSHCPLTKQTIKQVMADCWNNLPPALLRAHYQHCGLTRRKHAYFDCPDPASHAHAD